MKVKSCRSFVLLSAIVACLVTAVHFRVCAAAVDQLQGFEGGAAWINSAPLTPQELRGKVVLVDFWEYTCINCLRTVPYLREWYRRYRDDGFTIVGVHTPEFGFSGNRTNVTAAAQRLGITWPIVLDDRAAIWKRYGNDIWPHEFLYDQDGRLIESVLGEGAYPQTEARIQALLKRGNPHLALPPIMALLPQDSYDKPGAMCYPKTPELVVGHQPVANGGAIETPAQNNNYSFAASNPQDGAIYLRGYWRRTSEAMVSGENNGGLVLRYHAIQVIAVMKPEDGGSIRVEITQDGAPISRGDAGKDIRYDNRGSSYVEVNAARAYDIVMNAQYASRTLTLLPKSDGLGIYDFAFESCEIPKRAT
ncbi:MAG: redoxin family protein [Candidatus Eremiobacteraeota bacterium]|nr:redoxin family protein [Candidatus Eremiobacteraeota bacterium]